MAAHTLAATDSITAKALSEMIRQGKTVDLIDVRTPAEYRSAHVAVARSVPLESLDPTAVVEGRPANRGPLYVMCRSGTRSDLACAAFAAAGYGDAVVNVEGGLLACEEAGIPIVTGRYILPLDRQVRIAAGVLVLLGAVLGFLVNAWFYALSAYCGAGLIFAGVTDICPLRWTIAKMPWNQGAVDQASCPS